VHSTIQTFCILYEEYDVQGFTEYLKFSSVLLLMLFQHYYNYHKDRMKVNIITPDEHNVRG
jgi:hypothetical protein